MPTIGPLPYRPAPDARIDDRPRAGRRPGSLQRCARRRRRRGRCLARRRAAAAARLPPGAYDAIISFGGLGPPASGATAIRGWRPRSGFSPRRSPAACRCSGSASVRELIAEVAGAQDAAPAASRDRLVRRGPHRRGPRRTRCSGRSGEQLRGARVAQLRGRSARRCDGARAQRQLSAGLPPGRARLGASVSRRGDRRRLPALARQLHASTRTPCARASTPRRSRRRHRRADGGLARARPAASAPASSRPRRRDDRRATGRCSIWCCTRLSPERAHAARLPRARRSSPRVRARARCCAATRHVDDELIRVQRLRAELPLAARRRGRARQGRRALRGARRRSASASSRSGR